MDQEGYDFVSRPTYTAYKNTDTPFFIQTDHQQIKLLSSKHWYNEPPFNRNFWAIWSFFKQVKLVNDIIT